MEADDARAGLGEVGNDAVDRPHHQVHVERQPGMRLERGAHQRPDGEVRHVVVVHDIEMDEIRPGGGDGAHFLAEPGEVRGEDARRDAKGHGAASLQCCRQWRTTTTWRCPRGPSTCPTSPMNPPIAMSSPTPSPSATSERWPPS